MKSQLKSDPFTSTPLVTMNSMGRNVKRIYIEKKAEIFGKNKHATDKYQDGNKQVRVDYFLRSGVVIIMKVINPGFGQQKISQIEKLTFA
jgi:hypothetical protein